MQESHCNFPLCVTPDFTTRNTIGLGRAGVRAHRQAPSPPGQLATLLGSSWFWSETQTPSQLPQISLSIHLNQRNGAALLTQICCRR